MFTRREFLRTSSLLTLAPTLPVFLARTARAAPADKDSRVLVVVQLDGGNDALNTVIPYAEANYQKLRPKLRVEKKDVIKLSDCVGLHSALRPLDRLLQAGELAVLPGVGYPNPNRSHFESMAIWHTARFDAEDRRGYGWLGKALDPQAATAYVVGQAVPGAVRGRRSNAVALHRAEDLLLADASVAKSLIETDTAGDLHAFIRRQAVAAHSAANQLAHLAGNDDGRRYPNTDLAEHLRLVARLLKSNLGARVFYTVQAGYDTHAGQTYTHASLLSTLASAVAAFFKDLHDAKLADRVTLLAFSEFGRTIKENGSAGTDHGTAGAVFLAGPGIRGGPAGTMPSLTDLVNGEPRMTTDFRQVYASVLEDWLGLAATDVLGGTFQRPPVFRT